MSDAQNVTMPGRSEPRRQDPLLSYEPDVDAEYFDHSFGRYTLQGRIVRNDSRSRPRTLSIHDARADYTDADFITLGLRERGISILGMNLSGHSAGSGVALNRTTLGHNVAEAEAFYSYLDPAAGRSVIAYGLGCTTALEVAGRHLGEIDRIVLFGPSMYDTRAYSTSVHIPLRGPFGSRDNDVFSTLREFRGELLLVLGEFDIAAPAACGMPEEGTADRIVVDGETRYRPLPEEVVHMVCGAVDPARRSRIVVGGSDHAVARWLERNPDQGRIVLDRIAEFLTE